MRLFFCLTLPEQVRESLLSAQQALARQGRGNFTRPENLHVTLAFLGETENLDGAIRAMRHVQATPLHMALEGIGRFGDLYWADVALTPELADVQKQLEAALRAESFRLDSRPFRPHLTLCRQFRPKGTLDLSPVRQSLGMPRWTARELILMRSHRVDGVLTYTPLARQPLEE